MRWRGFKRVRRQVCKRIDQRITDLKLGNTRSYQIYLENNPEEWRVLDRLCRVTISRFYRDTVIFDYFSSDVFPALAQHFRRNKNKTVRVWSAGCASGEEPYTVAILWHYSIRPNYPDMRLEIFGTDIDPMVIKRANAACYTMSSLRKMPTQWLAQAFVQQNSLYLLQQHIKKYVRFEGLDIREQSPPGEYHIILCRNLAFTYFDVHLQQVVLRRLYDKIEKGGLLIIGKHEILPVEAGGLEQWVEHLPIYQKI
ncbi:MAG: CheR family methyltransferase [Desulfobulbales bacterium]